jgi:hypothetical protein
LRGKRRRKRLSDGERKEKEGGYFCDGWKDDGLCPEGFFCPQKKLHPVISILFFFKWGKNSKSVAKSAGCISIPLKKFRISSRILFFFDCLPATHVFL